MFYPESQIILEAIKQAKKILLHLHVSPDFDSLGSALAMREVLVSLGKEVMVIMGDHDLPVGGEVLPGASEIVPKSYSEIDLADFDLFIIQDSAALDRITAKEPVVFPEHLKTIVIDHHVSNPHFGQINLIDVESPATAYILYRLFKDWGVGLNETMAVNLFMGLYFDTGGFKFGNTTPASFMMAGELATIAPNYTAYLEKINNSWTPKHLEFVRLVLNNTHFLGGEKVLYSAISGEQMKAQEIGRRDTEMFSINAHFLGLKVVQVGFTVVEKESGITSVSARSKDGVNYDVSKWLSKLGGGGHKQAAGLKINEPLVIALPKILATLEETWPEFKQ